MRVELSRLPDFLNKRRWFAAKGWPLRHISLVDHADLELGGRSFGLAVVEVAYTVGAPERYALAVWADERAELHEAAEEEPLAHFLVELIRSQGEIPTGGGSLRGWRTEESSPLWGALPERPKVRRSEADQSNTSVVFGEQVILKLLRKIEPGLNPELEIGRFLARRHFARAPELMGWIDFTGPAASTVAVAHRFVAGAQDGWSFTLEAFRSSPHLSADFLGRIRQLGTRVGELHAALASELDDPAFSPEPLGTEDLQRWSSSIIGQLGVALSEAGAAAPELVPKRAQIGERARLLAHLTASGLKTRVHGDLHLGQVLWAASDWLVFDFEGEPGRSFAQRREKHTPLKDVAGILRSFDYAEAAAVLEGCPSGKRAQATRSAFLEGYWEATKASRFLPTEGETRRGLLDALELEKNIYELRYELQHRPDWVRIPARSLMEVAG
ncbi:MAG: phosphotransferase [Myxococcales bacterium]|nr:phosphotransferase [Myxococcales bacterium]